jgi:hypothetical protein
MDRTVGIVRCECDQKAERWGGVRNLFILTGFIPRRSQIIQVNKTGLERGLSAEAAEHSARGHRTQGQVSPWVSSRHQTRQRHEPVLDQRVKA